VETNDVETVDEAGDQLHKLLEDRKLRDAIILTDANKQDLPNTINLQELGTCLRLNSTTNLTWQVREASRRTENGLDDWLDCLDGQITKKF
jgi:ADP-ribosylation factor protein 6